MRWVEAVVKLEGAGADAPLKTQLLLGRSTEERSGLQTGPREIRPSGITGGPRKRKPWWDCEPVLQSKEQERKPSPKAGRARALSQPQVWPLEPGKPVEW